MVICMTHQHSINCSTITDYNRWILMNRMKFEMWISFQEIITPFLIYSLIIFTVAEIMKINNMIRIEFFFPFVADLSLLHLRITTTAFIQQIIERIRRLNKGPILHLKWFVVICCMVRNARRVMLNIWKHCIFEGTITIHWYYLYDVNIY